MTNPSNNNTQSGAQSIMYLIAGAAIPLLSADDLERMTIGALLLIFAGIMRIAIIYIEKHYAKATTSNEISKAKVPAQEKETVQAQSKAVA